LTHENISSLYIRDLPGGASKSLAGVYRALHRFRDDPYQNHKRHNGCAADDDCFSDVEPKGCLVSNLFLF
jgi:hypothetical protein